MRARRRTPAPAVALASALVAGALALRCVRRDELYCENAVALLERCCSGFHPDSSYCSYVEGCGTVHPTITEDDSECIVRLSCADIVSAGICARALNAIPPTDTTPGTDLCP